MHIKNLTDRPIVIALRDIEGYDDWEERLEPGQTSSDWTELDLEDEITIENG
jgi:hypothetical protein